jgi:hypothetical protein
MFNFSCYYKAASQSSCRNFFVFVLQYQGLNSRPHALQALNQFSHAPPSPFCFSYFGDRVSIYAQAIQNHGPPIYASHVNGTIGVCATTPSIGWDGGLLTFWPGWSQSAILLISTSQIAETTGVSHLCWTSYRDLYPIISESSRKPTLSPTPASCCSFYWNQSSGCVTVSYLWFILSWASFQLCIRHCVCVCFFHFFSYQAVCFLSIIHCMFIF